MGLGAGIGGALLPDTFLPMKRKWTLALAGAAAVCVAAAWKVLPNSYRLLASTGQVVVPRQPHHAQQEQGPHGDVPLEGRHDVPQVQAIALPVLIKQAVIGHEQQAEEDCAVRRLPFWTALFGLAGTIGLTSVCNTFMHIRTPLYLGFVRTAYSLLLGILVGALMIAGFELLSVSEMVTPVSWPVRAR